MKKLLLIIFFFSIIQILSAQQKRTFTQYEVSGTVVEKKTNQGLEFATIIFKPARGEKVFGGLTNEKGRFKFDVPAGMYIVNIEFISFKKKVLEDIKVDRDMDLGTLFLEEDAEALDEVEVIAEKSTVEIRLDKKIYNIGKDMTVKGGTASDVLDNVPSVTVDADGVVSLRGNESVRILINGKPSGLVGMNDTEALRQFPAEVIKQVEVITSPSARYDAEGTAGIINIILRQDKAFGFNGSITANTGVPTTFGFSTNLNYRLKKVNFFANIGYSNRESPGNAYTLTEYFSPDVTNPFLEEVREFDRNRKNLNTNFGLEYFITEKSSITASFLFRDSDGKRITTNNIDELNDNMVSQRSSLRVEKEDSMDKVNQYALNYAQNFNKSGHKLTLDFQYQDNSDHEKSLITNEETYPLELDEPSEKIDQDEKQNRLLFQGDYVLPIGENQQFEVGFRSNINNQTTDYKFYNEDIDGNFILNDKLSNIFIYDENIHAIYTQYGNKFGKVSTLFGLRMEITDIFINSKSAINEDFSTDKNYNDFFPTINLAYEFSETQNITLGYSRRIRRARGRWINPFPSQSSKTSIFQGNPFLDPSISNTLDLGYYKKWPQVGFNTSLYYNHGTDVFQFIREDTGQSTDEGIPIIRWTPINLSTEDRYGYEFSVNYTPIKGWRFNGSFNIYNSTIEGFHEGIDFGSNNTSWFTRMSAKIILPAKIDWQTTFMYRGPRETAQTEREGNFTTNMAFSRDIMKGNGTVSFNVSDLFNSRKRKGVTTTDTFTSYSEFQWRQRSFRLTFAYRFKQKKKRERQGGPNGDGEGEGF